MTILDVDKISIALGHYMPCRINTNPIFSYHTETKYIQQQVNISLIQVETNFKLIIKMERCGEQSIVVGFNLWNSDNIEEESFPLFHAATLDLALIGLDLIFFINKELRQAKIKFILNKEDAAPLLIFDYLFDYISHENNLFYLSMPLNADVYQLFIQKYELYKNSIGQKLWKMQKYDDLLKTYLQNPTKKNLKKYFGCTSKIYAEKVNKDNIIPFPKTNYLSTHA